MNKSCSDLMKINRKYVYMGLALFFIASYTSFAQKVDFSFQNKNFSIEKRTEILVSQMTYEEKLGQLSQRLMSEINEGFIKEVKEGKVGSLLFDKKVFENPNLRNEIQKIAIEQSRLGIPIIFGHDVIHGFQTIFPISLAQSCSWDPILVEKAASIAAKEASVWGIDWTFAPMIDVSRDPRWGRIAECFGEDTYLNAVFGKASVMGYQGANVAQPDKMLACLKHYVGYGAAMGGRDYQYTDISERSMQEVYLPPFKAGVDAGVLTVMSAFNDINGVPASANKKYLTTILKNKWKFPGFVVSDWDAVEQLMIHGYASDTINAATKALNAGVDMEMKSLTYQAIPESKMDKKVLNEAVKRIMFVKFKKGLFDTPFSDTKRIATDIYNEEHKTFARKVAAESMVLLENKNNILPFKDKVLTISVIGPFTNEKNLMGWWSSNGKVEDVVSPFIGLKSNAPKGITVNDKIDISTDVIVVCVGENYTMFGENNSRSSIELPNQQSEMIADLKKYGKPIVTIIFNGRPLALTAEKQNSDALLIAWHPGSEAGNALADILFGVKNPSGKLTTSFPRATGHIPVYYNHRNSGRPEYDTYKKESVEPLYPFGYGLSYSNFEYSDVSLSKKEFGVYDTLVVSAKITNKSAVSGSEVVQLFIRDVVGSTTRPIKELKGFQKIDFEAGETKMISFKLKISDLAILDENMNPVVEKGEFKLWVAPDSKSGLEMNFSVK